MSPLEGVADKQQSGENRHCLQGRFVERLAWERGEGFPPPQYTKGAKQMPNKLVKQISYILYKADEEDVKVNALLKDESIWLTQNSMAELFDVNVPAVSKHLKNIYECGELDEASTISILETVQKEGTRSVKRNVTFYRILKSDVNIAKNYLSEKQIRQLERAVSGYFDYIEDLIEREIPFNMEQFAASVNEFLEFRKYDILEGNGRISRSDADSKAFAEYEIFNKTQKIDSDFDKMIRKLEKK